MIGSKNVYFPSKQGGVFCAGRGWPQALQVCCDKNRDDSLLKKKLGFRTNRSQSQGSEKIVNSTNTFQRRKFFDWDLSGQVKACCFGQNWLRMQRCIKCNGIYWKFPTTITILMWRKNQWFDLLIVLFLFQAFGTDQIGRYEPSIYGKLRVSISI